MKMKKTGIRKPRYRRILMPTDLSPLGNEALAIVEAVAWPGTEVRLLHILEPMDLVAGTDGFTSRHMPEVKQWQWDLP